MIIKIISKCDTKKFHYLQNQINKMKCLFLTEFINIKHILKSMKAYLIKILVSKQTVYHIR